MICLNIASTNPHLNLATEEYLLKNFQDDVLMLWQGSPSIIVGKHQNMMAEVNYPFVHENGIPVARRLSGGGTVFHDLGNVNFTYIANGRDGHVVDFKRFTQPLVDFLQSKGVPAQLSGRNDILVDGYKFSGNAEHVFKKRVLHHGTLLFSSNLELLRNGIAPTGSSYTDSSVKSFRSKVTNLQSYFPEPLAVHTFKDNLFDYLVDRHQGEEYHLSSTDLLAIEALSESKYRSWEWNFGYSPDYKFTSAEVEGFTLFLEVKKGVISDAMLSKMDSKQESGALVSLVGISHDNFEMISQILATTYSVNLSNKEKYQELIY